MGCKVRHQFERSKTNLLMKSPSTQNPRENSFQGSVFVVFQGGNCHNSFSITPDASRPTSCLDYLLKGESKCGIYRLYDNAGNSFPAYCDLNSEPGTAWTLVMSWSWGTQYRSRAVFKRTPLMFDVPVIEYAIN